MLAGKVGIAVPEVAVFDRHAVHEGISRVESYSVEFGSGVDVVFDDNVVGCMGASEAIVNTGESV